jgi:hypothetical protein
LGILGNSNENQLQQAAEKKDPTQRPIFGVGDRYRFDNPEITGRSQRFMVSAYIGGVLMETSR